MTNKNYRKGYNFERKLVNELRKNKDCVFAVRSAGSHSSFDVIAIVGNELYLVQCKTGKVTDSIVYKAVEKCPDVPHYLSVRTFVATPKQLYPFVK